MISTDFPSLRPKQKQAAPPRGPSFRLLPVVIVAAICMLGFRIEVVVETIAHARHASLQLTPAVALAQAQPDKMSDKPGDKPADKGAKPAGEPGDDKMAEGDAKGGDMKAPAQGQDVTPPPSGGPPGFNASTLTKSEIETLQRLAERREQIEKHEHDLDAREGLMKAGEERIDGKIAQLHDLEKTIEGLLQKYDKQKQGEIEQLVRIYGAMKPKDAAGIFDTLDMPILVSVVQNMKEAKVAQIMSAMSREKARLLTEELSQRKQFGASGG